MWNKIKPHVPWNFTEFVFYLIFFNLMNDWLFDGSELSATTMIASCGLFMAIQTRRKLSNGEYK